MPKFKLGQAKRVANITFEGTDYDGLTVRCGLDLPLKTVMEIQKLSASEKQTEMSRRIRFGVTRFWNRGT